MVYQDASALTEDILADQQLERDVHSQEAECNKLMKAFITQDACYRHGPSEYDGPTLQLNFETKSAHRVIERIIQRKQGQCPAHPPFQILPLGTWKCR